MVFNRGWTWLVFPTIYPVTILGALPEHLDGACIIDSNAFPISLRHDQAVHDTSTLSLAEDYQRVDVDLGHIVAQVETEL